MSKLGNVPHRYARYAEIIFQEDASGWQTFKYGKLGEVTENIRTFALPFESRTYTFKMQYEYDSWNRIQRMTYPDGEVVTYGYNLGGLLERVSGRAVRQNVAVVHPDPERSGGQTPTPEPTVAYNYPYIDSIAYNKFEQKDTVWYGNGTRVAYAYDSLQRLLHLRSYEGHDSLMQDIAYTYDAVGNITDIDNAAGMLSNGLGGKYHDFHEYDNLYRLTYSSGDWFGVHPVDYKTVLEYLPNGRIGRKLVEAQTYRQTVYGNSTGNTLYDNRYHYNTTGQQNTLSYIDGGPYQEFRWDSMGNMTYHRNAAMALERHLCWDEQNRLQGVRDDGHLSFYLYDANGDRTCKFTGEYTVQNQTGRWQHFYQMGNATLYASPYLVVNRQGYTKHYYAGAERICSKIGGGGLGNIDSLAVAQDDLENKHASLKYHVRDVAECLDSPDYGFDTVFSELYYWKAIRENQETDGYWYHPDHLGSSSWITYSDGSAVQHLHYLPWGEEFVDQRSTDFSARYTFSAKEKDAETGYSYFGARYYNSDLSIWLSVDPMADKYPSMSSYVYCANNPVKLVDPNGEEIDDNLDKWKYNKDTKELTWLSDEGGRYHQIVVETENTPSGESVNRTVEFDGAIGQMFDFSVVSKELDGMINGLFDVYGGFTTSVAGAAIMSEGSVISGGAAFPVGAAIFSAGAYQSVNGLITIANAVAGRGVDMYEQQDIVRDICKSAGNSVASILSTSKNPKIQDVVKSIGKSTGSFILSATWTRFVRHATTHPTCNKVLPTGAIVH